MIHPYQLLSHLHLFSFFTPIRRLTQHLLRFSDLLQLPTNLLIRRLTIPSTSQLQSNINLLKSCNILQNMSQKKLTLLEFVLPRYFLVLIERFYCLVLVECQDYLTVFFVVEELAYALELARANQLVQLLMRGVIFTIAVIFVGNLLEGKKMRLCNPQHWPILPRLVPKRIQGRKNLQFMDIEQIPHLEFPRALHGNILATPQSQFTLDFAYIMQNIEQTVFVAPAALEDVVGQIAAVEETRCVVVLEHVHADAFEGEGFCYFYGVATVFLLTLLLPHALSLYLLTLLLLLLEISPMEVYIQMQSLRKTECKLPPQLRVVKLCHLLNKELGNLRTGVIVKDFLFVGHWEIWGFDHYLHLLAYYVIFWDICVKTYIVIVNDWIKMIIDRNNNRKYRDQICLRWFFKAAMILLTLVSTLFSFSYSFSTCFLCFYSYISDFLVPSKYLSISYSDIRSLKQFYKLSRLGTMTSIFDYFFYLRCSNLCDLGTCPSLDSFSRSCSRLPSKSLILPQSIFIAQQHQVNIFSNFSNSQFYTLSYSSQTLTQDKSYSFCWHSSCIMSQLA